MVPQQGSFALFTGRNTICSSSSSGPGSHSDLSLPRNHLMSKLVLLLIHFPNLRVLWSVTPYCTAELFAELKLGRAEPTLELLPQVNCCRVVSSRCSPIVSLDSTGPVVRTMYPRSPSASFLCGRLSASYPPPAVGNGVTILPSCLHLSTSLSLRTKSRVYWAIVRSLPLYEYVPWPLNVADVGFGWRSSKRRPEFIRPASTVIWC